MRVGCGSATIGMFASNGDKVDEVVVVDDQITVFCPRIRPASSWACAIPASATKSPCFYAAAIHVAELVTRGERNAPDPLDRRWLHRGGASWPDDADGLDHWRAACLRSASPGSRSIQVGICWKPSTRIGPSASARIASGARWFDGGCGLCAGATENSCSASTWSAASSADDCDCGAAVTVWLGAVLLFHGRMPRRRPETPSATC